MNGLELKNTFNKEVWFIAKDLNLQQMIESTPQTDTGNKMYDLLLELSPNPYDTPIQVDRFIKRISDILMTCHERARRSSKYIESFNVHERKNVIEEQLKMINDKIGNFHSFKSLFKSSLMSMDNFPSGDYSFELKIVEFAELEENNLNFLNRKIEMLRDVNIPEGGKKIVAKSTQYLFEPFEFQVLDESQLQAKHSDLIKNNCYSGTTISSFAFNCFNKKTKVLYSSKTEFLLDIMLNSIDKLLDMGKETFVEELNFKLKEKDIEEVELLIRVEARFTLDPLTRAGILKRIGDIFKDAIISKSRNLGIIDELLDNYFPEIADSVKNVLFSEHKRRDDCCASCFII